MRVSTPAGPGAKSRKPATHGSRRSEGARHLDVPARVESVQLVHNFKHGALNLVVPTPTVIKPCSTNSIDLRVKNTARHATTRRESAQRHIEWGAGASGPCKQTTHGRTNLIEEDNARLLGPRHLEQFPDHARPFTDVPATTTSKTGAHPSCTPNPRQLPGLCCVCCQEAAGTQELGPRAGPHRVPTALHQCGPSLTSAPAHFQ